MSGIAVVVVNHETRDHLRACLRSIRSEARELVVVDTGSSDGSPEMVRAEFGEATLVADIGNPGFGAAANEGIARCASPYVLLLNADTILRPGALAALERYLDEHPEAGVVGPRIVGPEDGLQRSTFPFPGPRTAFLGETRLGALVRFVPGFRNVYLRTWQHDRAREVPWVLGAAMAIRRRAFEAAGGLDPGFFLYFEETDLCYRLREMGWTVHFTPDATVVHVGGASTGQHRRESRLRYYAAMEAFYRRHRSPAARALMRGIVRLTRATAWIRDSVRLRLVRDPESRGRLAADVQAWKAIALDSIPAQADVAGRGRAPDAERTTERDAVRPKRV